MALSASVAISQTKGLPSILTLTDNSTGSDGTVTYRRVFIQTANGTYLVKNGTTTTYETWLYSASAIDLDLLDKDYALTILVKWYNAGNAELYSFTTKVGVTLYNEAFDYGLTQLLSGNPLLVNDGNYFKNKSDLRTYIDSGNSAVIYADLYNAQLCYDQATQIRLKSQFSF